MIEAGGLMRLPQGCCERSGKVVRLKGLYGVRQASRSCHSQ